MKFAMPSINRYYCPIYFLKGMYMFFFIFLLSNLSLQSMENMESRFASTVATYQMQDELTRLNKAAFDLSKKSMDTQNQQIKDQADIRLVQIAARVNEIDQQLEQHKNGIYYQKSHELALLAKNILREHKEIDIAETLCQLQQRFNNFQQERERRP
jgi:hypothetical protein